MSILPELDDPRPRVDPPYLVTRSLTALPQRCIKTNEPVSDVEYQVWDLPCIPRWLLTLMFVGPFFLLTGPYVRQRCKLKAGLSKSARRKRLLVRALLMGVVLSPLLGAAMTIMTMSPAWGFYSVTAITAAFPALTLFVLQKWPMRVRRVRGELCWISGCSPEFLAGLEAGGRVTPGNDEPILVEVLPCRTTPTPDMPS
jgi:hypothetical protein